MRFESHIFVDGGELPSYTVNTVFSRCTFKGRLPNFSHCEFHDCNLQGLKINRLTHCKLFNCDLNNCDFSWADVTFSITNPGSPCRARGCEWQGVAAIMDCSFFSGLLVDDKAPYLFMMMALTPITLDSIKSSILRFMPESARQDVRQRMSKDFRKV